MTFEAFGRPFLKKVLLAASAAVLLPWAAAASEAGTSGPGNAPAGAHAPSVPSAAVNGVVVTWSLANGRFESPAPEQAAELVRELQRLLAGGLADRVGLESGAPVAKRTASGLLKARVPAALLDLAVVRVGAGGSFAPSCTQAPGGTLQTLSEAPAATQPAER
jgi:hypothetical protein